MLQTLNQPVSATSDANGNATFVFPSIPNSQYWTGIVQCPTAPYTAQHTAQNGADYLGSFSAGNPFGPLYLPAGQLKVITTGLVPNTVYLMYLTGYVSTEVITAPVFPMPSANTVIATNQGGLDYVYLPGVSPGEGGTFLSTPPSGFAYRIHSLTIRINVPSSSGGNFVLTNAATAAFFAFYINANDILQSQTFLFNGQLINTEIIFSNPGGAYLAVSMFYDLVEI